MPQAQNDLGLIYMQGGNGVKQNPKTGFSLLKKAAEQGHPAAMFYLSLCYASGQGTTANKTETKKWLQKAAQQDLDPEVKKMAKDALKQF
jgi:TPR repeat protein